jgi:hypothetical protein
VVGSNSVTIVPPQGIHPKECTVLLIRRILFPTDFSEHSGWAFPLACSLARDHGASMVGDLDRHLGEQIEGISVYYR